MNQNIHNQLFFKTIFNSVIIRLIANAPNERNIPIGYTPQYLTNELSGVNAVT